MFRRAAVLVLLPPALVLACSRGNGSDRAPPAADAAATTTQAATLDASVAAVAREASLAATAAPAASARPLSSATDPFGVARTSTRAGCAILAEHRVSKADLETSFVDGDDLLAIVNRSPSGQLAPDYAPSDLIDVQSKKPLPASECDKFLCLRKEAAAALDELLVRMKAEGFPGHVESAFRSYGAQCGTFGNWARKGGFCDATEQSALPGHSQHQLGTTVDLFTEEWAEDPRGVFREGFGCTPAGRFLREHATELGFVMPYPIHPDDRHPRQKCVVRWDIPININPRTGYRFEHWHIRYVGKDAAARFKAAFDASTPGKPSEITVEQWLRAEKGLTGPDAELPVCDGCNCGACSTLAGRGDSLCDATRKGGGALHLDAHGKPLETDAAPTIESASRGKARKWHGKVVALELDVPAGTVTQPPIVGLDAAGYAPGATFEALAPYPDTEPRGYAPIAGAWAVGLEPIPNDTHVAWPYRAALTPAVVGQIYNRADVLLPTRGGATTLRVPLPSSVRKVRVVMLKGGVPDGPERTVDLD
jgi:D-alanyl-D-alanine carboxypeptidase